ncbi:hypothetical protein [Gloeocapsopsis dulcis]|uniref:Uncharacterized protein n=1 Tax=Gloeocapsopsis dulcis AAB1 = 1H9 TaxID=1433147 RepID=A0A6N8FYC8_9CHRO|nr:hypothetical protein [Gloeocapsopsis dulcis]MUL37849.1 hypothetical protein [Gloeocapsopsis dulcis AAB1 = 1H9]WNN89811.1 hypothetical protein P0S91_01565 [Gloeocapsopsis dulcis]
MTKPNLGLPDYLQMVFTYICTDLKAASVVYFANISQWYYEAYQECLAVSDINNVKAFLVIHR